MEVYKEIKITPFSNISNIWIIIILLLPPFVTYYRVSISAPNEAMYSALLVLVIIMVMLVWSSFDYKKAIITCVNDTLNIQFIKKYDTKEYSVNLLTISEYKEVYSSGITPAGYLVFKDNDFISVTIPYNLSYQGVRKEILNILQNYNIKKTLVF